MAAEGEGILSTYGLPVYDQEQEELIAKVLLLRLDNQLPSPLPSVFGFAHWQVRDIEFRKRLVKFALARRISLSDPQWEHRALRAAAEEHPEMQSKRKKGRPSNSVGGGLLSFTSPRHNDDEALEWVIEIDEINSVRRAAGKRPFPDRAAAKALARQMGSGNETLFASRTQVFANRITKARAFLGRQIRPKKTAITKK